MSEIKRVHLSTLLEWASLCQQYMDHDGLTINGALERFKHRTMHPNDRKALQALLYEVTRRKAFSQAALRYLVPKPLNNLFVKTLLEVAIAILFSNSYENYTLVNQAVLAIGRKPENARFKGLANAVLRRTIREKDELVKNLNEMEAVRYNAPQWWINRVKKAWPQHFDQILKIGLLHPPQILRVNTRKTSVPDYLKRLEDTDYLYLGHEAILLQTPCTIDNIPGFADGLVSIQDAGTQLAAHLLPLKEGDRVLDACAAPGGKTAHMLESFQVQVTALEIDPQRAQKIHSTLDRLQLHADVVVADACCLQQWWNQEPFDAILLDAPCTASGIVRRHPDIPWSRQPDDIDKLAKTQKLILEQLWKTLKQQGYLLYSTCSIFPEEGPKQIQQFLQSHPDASLISLQGSNEGMMKLIPTDTRFFTNESSTLSVHDGFFYALLQKV